MANKKPLRLLDNEKLFDIIYEELNFREIEIFNFKLIITNNNTIVNCDMKIDGWKISKNEEF